jgi:hypothetical protein
MRLILRYFIVRFAIQDGYFAYKSGSSNSTELSNVMKVKDKEVVSVVDTKTHELKKTLKKKK